MGNYFDNIAYYPLVLALAELSFVVSTVLFNLVIHSSYYLIQVTYSC